LDKGPMNSPDLGDARDLAAAKLGIGSQQAERARRRQAHGQTAPGKTLQVNSPEAAGQARDLAAAKLGIIPGIPVIM
jgi:hypothetical protein